MRETAVFPLPVWNLTSPSRSSTSTPISSKSAKISAIRVYLGMFRHFRHAMLTHNELVFPFGGSCVSVAVLVKSVKKCDRKSAHRRTHTDRLTDVNRFCNLSDAICYSHGTDNNVPFDNTTPIYLINLLWKLGFLPRCMQCRRGIAMRILSVRLSVCPSVCLSHACIVTKR